VLHLIVPFVPKPLHRAILRVAHRVRHRWRGLRGVPIAGVSVLLTNISGDLLLLRHSYGPAVWSLPGGGLKASEDPVECARREMREELGVEILGMRDLGRLEEILSGAPHTAYLFAGRCDTMPRPDEREIIEARFFPTHSLPEPMGDMTRQRIAAWRARQAEA
jgi:ADP-ribose pyrophosphatase YjhB (NUDIX family)